MRNTMLREVVHDRDPKRCTKEFRRIAWMRANRRGDLIMRGLIGGWELAVLQEQADRVIAQGLAGQREHHLYRRFADIPRPTRPRVAQRDALAEQAE